jgi:hypothetical protein
LAWRLHSDRQNRTVRGQFPFSERLWKGGIMMGRKVPVSSSRSLDGTREPTDQIVSDLRSFAHDLGIPGCSAMSKDELVESLRQCYILTTLQSGTRQARAR